jgi:hypothetical protein
MQDLLFGRKSIALVERCLTYIERMGYVLIDHHFSISNRQISPSNDRFTPFLECNGFDLPSVLGCWRWQVRDPKSRETE